MLAFFFFLRQLLFVQGLRITLKHRCVASVSCPHFFQGPFTTNEHGASNFFLGSSFISRSFHLKLFIRIRHSRLSLCNKCHHTELFCVLGCLYVKCIIIGRSPKKLYYTHSGLLTAVSDSVSYTECRQDSRFTSCFLSCCL